MTAQRDKVFVSEIECIASIGVSREERSMPQRLSIDVEVRTDARAAATHDDIGRAIDYGRIVATVVDLAAGREYHLLETLAESIAGRILSELGGQSVRVLVRKLTAPIPTPHGFVAVEVVREAESDAN